MSGADDDKNMQTSGGAAAAGGFDFQDRFCAYIAVHLLAERLATPPWGLEPTASLISFRCETGDAVDDIVVVNSLGGHCFVQAKRSLTGGRSENSELRSALKQCVTLYLERATTSPLVRAKDRLVIATSPTSTKPIRLQLPLILTRLRSGNSLSESANSEEEKTIRDDVVFGIKAAWKAVISEEPSDKEVADVLAFLHIHVADVEPDGLDEKRASDLLRQSILETPDDASAAWNAILIECRRCAAGRHGADIARLQELLGGQGITLKAVPSYRRDAIRLQKHSEQTAALLREHSRIRLGGQTIKVPRHCVLSIYEASKKGSIVVLGGPGTGKSGALVDLYTRLHSEELPTLLFNVASLSASSLGALRSELNLEHELVDVLQNYGCSYPGVLIIDSLDADRGGNVFRTMLDLITILAEKAANWHVVASIRTFDLRYSSRLQKIFRGLSGVEDYQDNNFRHLSHLAIGDFSVEELDFIGRAAVELKALIDKAPTQLRQLLHNPFNMRLAAEIVEAGITPAELHPISSQIELLTRYWTERVAFEPGRQLRESVLTSLCRSALTSGLLSQNRRDFARSGGETALSELLSAFVLTESAPDTDDRVEFSHHILFDYATSRLLFRGPGALLGCLNDFPTCAIVARPAIELHFQFLWNEDTGRAAFWAFGLELAASQGVRRLVKTVAPSVTVALTQTIEDLDTLMFFMQSERPARDRQGAVQYLRCCIASLRLQTREQGRVVNQEPWRVAAVRLLDLGTTEGKILARMVLFALSEGAARTEPQVASLGHLARRFVTDALQGDDPGEHALLKFYIRIMIEAYDSNPTETEELIRNLFEPANRAQHGYKTVPAVADRIELLVEKNSAFAADIYHQTFTYTEVSNEVTAVGSSQLLALSSNRKQDYEMAYHLLESAFPFFLKAAPEQGVIALARLLDFDSPTTSNGSQGGSDQVSVAFTLFQTESTLTINRGVFYIEDDEKTGLLVALADHLAGLANEEKTGELVQALAAIALHNKHPRVWDAICRSALKNSPRLVKELVPILMIPAILLALPQDLSQALFSAVWQALSDLEQLEIENAIVSVVTIEVMAETRDWIQTELLSYIGADNLKTDAARGSLIRWNQKCESEYSEPTEDTGVNEPSVNVEQTGTEDGIFGSHSSTIPEPNLRQKLARLEAKKAVLFTTLQEACQTIADSSSLTFEEGAGWVSKLVDLAKSENPKVSNLPRFDWIVRQPTTERVQAAQGLLKVAQNPNFACDSVLQTIEDLAADPIPEVRAEIVLELHRLVTPAPELTWKIAERIARSEPTQGVLMALQHLLHQAFRVDKTQVAKITEVVLERDGILTNHQLGRYVGIMVAAYLSGGAELAGTFLDRSVRSRERWNVLEVLPLQLKTWLLPGCEPASSADAKTNTQRAFGLLTTLANTCTNALYEGSSAGGQEGARLRQSSLRVLDQIALTLFAAAGVSQSKSENLPSPFKTEEVRRNFSDLALPILHLLAVTEVPSTAHHLVETLELFIDVAPGPVLLCLAKTLKSAERSAYQTESMAAKVIVRILARYLAGYRSLLIVNDELKAALLDSLDTIVDWPEGVELAYGLNILR